MTRTERRPADGVEQSLATSASRGAVVMIGGQAVRVIVQLAGVVILARLLGPTDFGLVAMVTAVIGIGEVFRDFGLSSAAVQAKTLSPHQKDNLFWINTGIGAVLTVVTFLLASPIASLYGDDRLRLLTEVLSITFLLNGLSTQFRADLGRHLGFGRLVVADAVGQAIALVAAIVVGVMGGGYWALAVQQVGQAALVLIVLVIVTDWYPRGIHRHAGMKPLLSYGVTVFLAQMLNYVSRNVDSVIIGARFGPASLGLYNRSFQLVMLPLLQLQAPATRVALPVLSRLQDQRDRFNAFISFGQTTLLAIVGLMFAFLGAQATAVVSIMLGEQWLEAVPVFQILLIAGWFQAAAYVSYWVFLSKGLTKENLWSALVTRPLTIGLILLGSLWGVYGVAAGFALGLGITWPIALFWISKVSDVDAKRLFLNGLRMIIVFGIATGASYASTLAVPADQPLLHLAIGSVALLGMLALEAAIWPRFRADVLQVIGARRYLSRARTAPASQASDPDAPSASASATSTDTPEPTTRTEKE
ncbi:lipopolysaccharide biosynthesis protein [Leifsonia flava]|uniref:Lipopolysaccharide biosynthesis protein n=1 Tax=Orlajensenia leifsoniae TaxID=2561933 RepID=A0A4Y9QY25_9MICO|nr:lipopolysaccharide biosynthesis protein [Leifsonia flava]TFV96970.1 lipopolysaccharide biosynthesis protein [Leifsonia flava]